MKIDEVKILAEMVAPENKEKFLTVVRYFVKWREGDHFGFYISPNNDYSKIKKFKVAWKIL